MSKAQRTREFIVERTAPLFNKKGFDGTTLADLTNATGLTKGALYGNFEDKEDIAQAAFRFSINKVKEMVRAELEEVSTNKKQLIVVLDFYAKYVNDPPIPGGCPLLNTAIEADDNRPEMRKVVAKELISTVNFLAGLLKKGIKAGEFVSTVKPNELAYVFFCSIEGALMFSRAEKSSEPMEIVVRHCKNLLDKISK